MTAVVESLRWSHEHLRVVADKLSGRDLERQSHCSEWSVAQVFSHLGSGAQIAGLWLRAAIEHSTPPGRATLQDTWARWDAKSPADQVSDCLAEDDAYIRNVAAMTTQELSAAKATFPGRTTDGVELATARLVEHVLHTWDIEVALDPAAVLYGPVTDDLLGFVTVLAAHRGKPTGRPWSLNIHTREPSRGFLLTVADSVRIEPVGADEWNADGLLTLDAEALVRLVYGRLDTVHTSNVELIGGRSLSLDTVRSVFAG